MSTVFKSFIRTKTFLHMAPEIVSKILEYADYKTVTTCRRLCRRLKDIVDTTASLRYMVKLGAAGMCDGPPDTSGSAERLKRLEHSQAAWQSSVWSQPEDFPYSKKIFPFPVALSGNLVVLKGPICGNRRTGELLLLRFPSEARGIPEQQWSLDLGYQRIEAISLDDSQDLLVFSRLPNIHVRTLSSGSIHPLSTTRGIIDSGVGYVEYESFSLRIHDDRLAFMTSVGRQILVWDWMTGNQIAKIPCDQRFSTCAFLDRSSILFPYLSSGQKRTLCFQVATFESPNTTEEAALRFHHFELDVLGPQPERTYFLSMNTLPSNASDSCFPGFFHSEPTSRLLALEVETPVTDFMLGGDIPLRVLYVPHDAILGYIRSHPSEADTVVVPWVAWGPGNAQILTLPDPSPDRFLGSKIACGMHAVTEPPMIIGQGDQMMLRIIDYHPKRIAHNPVTQDAHLRLGGAADSHERLGSSSSAAWQEVCMSTDKKIPYAFKDIPLPSGLGLVNIKCVLGEDVVALFEYSLGTFRDFGHRIEKVFYHPI
ncbi:hypothetical protein EI94DRAFT_1727952 [Lactarius quietus]|nr:hypothetical protein EI94DRAFT_1727952 [Lactarius quietus]